MSNETTANSATNPGANTASTQTTAEPAIGRWSLTRWLKYLCVSGEVVRSWPVNIAMLVLRVGAGLGMALLHGWSKLPPPEAFVEGLADKGFPVAYLLAWLVGIFEVLAGISLALGLATRVAATSLLTILGVAIFVWHAEDPFAKIEAALAYFIPSVFFLLTGGGLLSIDALLRRSLRGGRGRKAPR